MSDATTLLEIVDGPDKPAMQWAIAYPDREEVQFRLADDALDARLDLIEELGPGFDFRIAGVITTGPHKGKPFTGTYSVEGRRGTLQISA